MLTFAEELLLLTLDDESGVIKELPAQQMDRAMVGAVLMEMAMANRIDTDDKRLHIIDATPAPDPMQNVLLDELKAHDNELFITDVLDYLSIYGRTIRDRTLEHLISKGILRLDEQRILWVFERRRYPLIDNREIEEVKSRLRHIILGDDLPDPRDAILISLVDACGLFREIFSLDELKSVCGRIKQLAKLDFIGQKLAAAVRPIQSEMIVAMAAYAPSCGNPI
ncbi:MAG: GPP34 family phosphoprotein [Spartobacteria bacterium]|nr:GPP34 family phosphoprotein [Spartobacteria bacterium]